jgi:hypothetical protein
MAFLQVVKVSIYCGTKSVWMRICKVKANTSWIGHYVKVLMLKQVQHDLMLVGSSAVENNKREHISTALDVTIDTLVARTRSD